MQPERKRNKRPINNGYTETQRTKIQKSSRQKIMFATKRAIFAFFSEEEFMRG